MFETPLMLGIYGNPIGTVLPSDPIEVATGANIDTGNGMMNTVLVIIPMVLTLAIASFTYRFIELPGIALGKRLRKAIVAPVLPGGASMG
ncbi:hypothetical protein [Pseudomonas sp. dw_358]|uniref:hypothetical protein n=1 Tax=Pseudomonas sp. dw_358 TaxID=2720083 RepID=UPI001BD5AB1D|nr:hypothetical protein [Pseudomonas sp. dw_358]